MRIPTSQIKEYVSGATYTRAEKMKSWEVGSRFTLVGVGIRVGVDSGEWE